MGEWRPIPGFVGYEAHSDGLIRSVDRLIQHPTHVQRAKGRILRPAPGSSGHVSVVLGRGNTVSVHILVAITFHGPCPEGCEVLHKDGDPANNAKGNLRYGTRAENNRDIALHGRRKLTVEQVHAIRAELAAGGRNRQLARKYGVNSGTIHSIQYGTQYSHV